MYLSLQGRIYNFIAYLCTGCPQKVHKFVQVRTYVQHCTEESIILLPTYVPGVPKK